MSIKLTQTVQKGGCAAKVSANELRLILKNVKFPDTDSNVLVNGSTFDDCSVYKLNETQALIQTLDFFTPIVDDPYDFGRVAAANSLSDIYAMGARPKTSLAILAFPILTLSNDIIQAVLQGAADQVKLSQSFFLGGHSIDDDTLKFGLSVSGIAHPNKIWSNQNAQENDHLILTKGLGTGTLTAAIKRDSILPQHLKGVIDSMTQLNNIMDYLSEEELSHIHAATDITGFGLMGHALHIARASQKTLNINFNSLPFLDGALAALEAGFLTKAHRTNKEYTQEFLSIDSRLSSIETLGLFDPQTSGGLLLSVSPQYSKIIYDQLKKTYPMTQIIGQVSSYRGSSIVIEK